MLARVPDWPLRLNAAIEAARNRPFVWGEHDCCLWAAYCVRLLTGVDHAAVWRGYYTDARGGLKLLAKSGGVEALATAALGAPIAAKQAQRGDVVLVKAGRRTALGVCVGPTVAAPGVDGLLFVPMSQWIKAWRV